MDFMGVRLLRCLGLLRCLALVGGLSVIGFGAAAQTSQDSSTPPPKAAPSTPKASTPETTPSPSTPPAAATPTQGSPNTKAPEAKTPEAKTPEAKTPEANTPAAPSTPDTAAPKGKPGNTEIEPHGSPGIPQNATTESVDVPARPALMVPGQSSYDEAFKSIKASLDAARSAMDKASLKASGHPVTIFSEPDDKGFKYKVAVPIAAKPDGKPDLGTATIGDTPSGKAIKFQHRGAYEDIDSTYDVITAYLDAKGLQAATPYIEEYLTDLTTADDPNLQVDIYVFVK